jgi:hypothetical protein
MPTKRTRHSKPKTQRNGSAVASVPTEEETSKLKTGLDNEGFVVDLFLDQSKQVQLTQILHVKSNDGEGWHGWDERRLMNFFIDRAQLSIPESIMATPEPVVEKSEQAEMVTSHDEAMDLASDEPPPATTELAEQFVHVSAGAKTKRSASVAAKPAVPEPQVPSVYPPAPAKIVTPTEHRIEIISADTHSAGRLLMQKEPFGLRISLGDSNLLAAENSELDYTASVFALKKGQNSKYFIAVDRGTIQSTDEAIQVRIPRHNLERGTYCLSAEIAIMSPAQPEGDLQPVLLSSLNLKSGLLQVI